MTKHLPAVNAIKLIKDIDIWAAEKKKTVRMQKRITWTDEEDKKIIAGKNLNWTNEQIAEGIEGKDAKNVYSRWQGRKRWMDATDFEKFKNNKKQKTE